MSRLLALAFAALLALASPYCAFAQGAASGVGDNAATDRGVQQNPSRAPADEQQLLNVLRQSAMPDGPVRGNVYIPDPKAAVLVQPEGRTWRDFRVTGARWTHVILIALALLFILALALLRGAMTYRPDPQGRRLLRFNAFDRFVHWMTATSFVLLALSGLNVVFGRIVLQPWLGDGPFSTFSFWSLNVHNVVGYAFLLGILAMAVMWARDNLFRDYDWNWLRRGGGVLGGEEPPAGKFNAGQKMIYWGAVIGGLIMGATGILMTLPISLLGVNAMQWVHGGHSVVAGLMIALIIGHIYLGVWFVRGSFDAMARGDVDLNWARKHHPLWADRVTGEAPAAPLARGPRGRPPQPAE
jgi:formate dehydrogenase subunit gamma